MQRELVIVSIPNYNQRCKVCNSFIVFDSSKREHSGKYIPLDLNGKRHFCYSVDRIIHEEKIVQQFKKECDRLNSTELSSFGIEPKIIDEVQNAD